MGLFSDEAPAVQENLLDTLSAQLATLCSFQPGERDLVMLQHKFVVEWKDGSEVGIPYLHDTYYITYTTGQKANYKSRALLLLLWSSLANLVATLPWRSLLG